MNGARTVHVVLPDGIDDPARPSGGNAYDRRVCDGLEAIGWSVHEHPVPGAWPEPGADARAGLARVLAGLPDQAVVLVDGLIASSVPELLVPLAGRLRLVVLVHMPLGATDEDDLVEVRTRERAVVSAAAAVVTTSAWTRGWLLDRYELASGQVHVAQPGADVAALAPGTASGGRLLCVAAVLPGKGQDLLVDALATVVDLPWHCVCVGSLVRDADFVSRLRAFVAGAGIGDRVVLAGPRTGEELALAYAGADLLVHPSRAETYGMVVTEALARGTPVVATAVGGLPEALGRGAGGLRPGLLVPPGDTAALAAALRRWLSDSLLRADLREAAQQRRGTLSGWSQTSLRVSQVLDQVAA